MKKAILCDIDGVLLDSTAAIQIQQNKLAQGVPQEESWQYYYDNLHLCIKNEWCYRLIESLARDYKIIFLTARDEQARKDTVPFLKFNTKVDYELYMRPHGVVDTDTSIKHKILNELMTKYEFIFAIDDRKDNCEMYRMLGIQPLHVLYM